MHDPTRGFTPHAHLFPINPYARLEYQPGYYISGNNVFEIKQEKTDSVEI
jgi:hypothetical protein